MNELSFSQTPHDQPEVNIPQLNRQGYAFLKQGLYTEALICFRSITEASPENKFALVGIGDSYRKQQRFNEAIPYYQRCLKTHPQNNFALFGLADSYQSLKQYRRAIEVWETYLTLDDRNVTVLTRVGDAYRKVMDKEKSTAMYRQVLAIEPANAFATIGLAHLYYDSHEYREAMQYWLQMVEQYGPGVNIRVLTSLGNCHRKLRSFEAGVPWFRNALEREANNFYALFGLADCFRGLDKPTESLDCWNRILAGDPGNKSILTRAADAYRKIGSQEKAFEYYQRVLQNSFDPYALRGSASILLDQGKLVAAVQSLEQLIERAPQFQRSYPDLLACYIQIGNRSGAELLCQKFEKLGKVIEPVKQQMTELSQQL
jgi:tetratricopeptide (TPR) repeat protein